MANRHYTNQQEAELIQAINLAVQHKLIKPKTKIFIDSSGKTCVSIDPLLSTSILSINPNDTFFQKLKHSGLAATDCWLLVISHEAAHLHLNDKCLNANDPLGEANAQLKAMGIPLEEYANTPDHFKESAIETYCDASLAKTAREIFNPFFRSVVKNVIKERDRNSLKTLLMLEHSDYETGHALRQILDMPASQNIDPAASARIALNHLKSQNFKFRNLLIHAKQATKTEIVDLFDNAAIGLKTIKAKILKSRNNDQDEDDSANKPEM